MSYGGLLIADRSSPPQSESMHLIPLYRQSCVPPFEIIRHSPTSGLTIHLQRRACGLPMFPKIYVSSGGSREYITSHENVLYSQHFNSIPSQSCKNSPLRTSYRNSPQRTLWRKPFLVSSLCELVERIRFLDSFT